MVFRCEQALIAAAGQVVHACLQVPISFQSQQPASRLRGEAISQRPQKVVKGRGDKLSGSDLEKILKDKGIETVIIVGTSANSAVMYTAFGAVQRGFKPIVPIDGLPSETAYQEQFTIWQIANGSQLSDNAVLTRLDQIKF